MTEIPQNVRGLVCVECGATYREGEVLYTCPQCGPSGILDIQYDYDRLEGFRGRLEKSQECSLWRYRELLPVTGNGLKDIRHAVARSPEPIPIRASLDDVAKVMGPR